MAGSQFVTVLMLWGLFGVGPATYSTVTIKQAITTSVSVGEGLDVLLQDILLKSLRGYKCVAIFADSLYLPLFQRSWFRRFAGHASFVLVYTEESEDLLAPRNGTQASMGVAGNDGCQMYIILVANGLQVGRLLKFGDRFRLLNTRANYVLLFDRRLFRPELLFLWKRIINVVFIKKFSGKAVHGDWYELTTVPFPRGFDDVLVPRRLDIWTRSKFRKGADLFRDKTADLKNETLRVAAFAHLPGTLKTSRIPEQGMPTSNDQTFTGSEIEILKAMAKQMNFGCELYEPEGADVELWGRKQVGETYTGLLGEMGASRADVALGDLYYIPFVLNIMDLSVPYNTECLTFLTPEALTDISWKTLILPFSPMMWLCVLVCLALTSAVFYWLARFHQEIAGSREAAKSHFNPPLLNVPRDMKYSVLMEQYRRPPRRPDEPEGLFQFAEAGNSVLYSYSMLLLVSLPKLPTGWSLRLLTGWYWLYCLLVVVAYRASMTAILSRPTPRVTIDSLPELLASRLTYGGWGEINTEFFKSSADDFINTIRAQFVLVNSSEEALSRVVEGHFAFYENVYFLKQAVSQQQIQQPIGSRPARNLHIMRDCIINMPVSIGLQKNSPLKPRVDQLIRRVLEAGLVNKWLNDVMKGVTVADHEDSGAKALMDLKKMYGALVVLAIGYAAGLSALMGELLHFRHSVKKQR